MKLEFNTRSVQMATSEFKNQRKRRDAQNRTPGVVVAMDVNLGDDWFMLIRDYPEIRSIRMTIRRCLGSLRTPTGE